MSMCYSSNQQILSKTIDWIDSGHRVALVTVIRTWGSSPRPVGSLLVMRDDGQFSGSVSGGCIEEDLLQRYLDKELELPTLLDYGSSQEDTARFGLPCGGRLELYIETPESIRQLQSILDAIDQGQLIARRVCLTTGEISLHPATVHDHFEYHENHIRQIFGSTWHMLLIGAGQLSAYVARIAIMLDFQVTVCDPREEMSAQWEVDGAGLLGCMPDDAVRQLQYPQRSVVITLTHDPRLDDMALAEALGDELAYTGALGSRRTSAERRKRLVQLGLNDEQIARLHAPVGLPIGSHTPAEIAVSIMAQIVAVQHGKADPSGNTVTPS